MNLIMNFGLAWISVFIALFLALAYITRKAIIKFPRSRAILIKLNKALRRHHKIIGAALVITGLLHGIFSSDKLFSMNWGTYLWIISILLGISWMLKKKLSGKKNWMYYHRILVFLFTISIVIHVVDAGGIQIFKVVKASNNIQVSNINEPENTGSVTPVPSATYTPSNTPEILTPSPTIEIPKGNIYKDGTYTGEATGYQPGLVISITIEDNVITSIEVVDHNEVNSRFWSTPVNYIPDWIVEAQSTEVDTITGATYTSIGIINAVNDALRQALVSGIVPDDLSRSSSRGH